MESDSVDAIVTDPPYALGFGGASWDTFGKPNGTESVAERMEKGRAYDNSNAAVPKFGNSHGKTPTVGEMRRFQEEMTPIFEEAIRVAKPGAHMLCFGGTRTFHRIACAIEDAGWIVKDCMMWVYGSGMPHGQNVRRMMEKGFPDDAWEWEGWNTHLKPAWEPIILAYKPLSGTVVNNVRKYGTGAINIDACRIPTSDSLGGGMKAGSAQDGWRRPFMDDPDMQAAFVERKKENIAKSEQLGRYPANLVHDGSDEVVAMFPSTGKSSGGGGVKAPGKNGIYGKFNGHEYQDQLGYGDTGSAARFFYCAKASKKDRNCGDVKNDHPCVKPNALMRYLVKLVCRQGGVVMDPFMGSGSTGVACMDEGMRFVGIDMDSHYCEIADSRMRSRLPHDEDKPNDSAEKGGDSDAQLTLFDIMGGE